MAISDTLHAFETPEGVELVLHPAGPMARIPAFLIDALIRYGAVAIAALILFSLGGFGKGAFFLLLFFTEWLYPVAFEVLRGRTPGKQAMGLEVVHDNGTPVGWSASLVRNLLRVVEFLPALYALGLVSMFAHPRFKRLGDLAAGTLVVYTERPPEPGPLPRVAPRRPPVSLSRVERRALVDFAERSTRLSSERVDELAALLEEGENARDKVLAYSNFLMRGR